MLIKEDIVSFLRKSLILDDPSTVVDEAYKYTDDDLWDIVKLVVPLHNPAYTIENFPENETYFVIILAKKEVYYRLATASAPFYPLRAEGAELRKDYRFEHYMSLIRRLEVEYEQMWDRFENNKPINVGELILKHKHFTTRNYNLATRPEVELYIDSIGTDFVNISWTKFNVTNGMFSSYTLYLSKNPIYDEYEDKISDDAVKIDYIQNIHKTKYKIKDLEEDTTYYVAIISEDMNKLKGISEKEFKTLATPVEETEEEGE